MLVEWIQFKIDMVTMFVQNDMKKTERKARSESRDIDENKIVHWLRETFGIIRRLAGRMTSNTFLWRHGW